MKKLFSTEKTDAISIVEEGKVYSAFDFAENKRRYFDVRGQELAFYRPPEQKESIYDEQYTDDPTQTTPVFDGFCGYTSSPDGVKGCFGLKTGDGRKVTEEIFAEIGCFSNRLCPVRNEDGRWGCINKRGELVIPYRFREAPQFNEYGVAVGDHALIDEKGEIIPDTELNLIDACGEYSRYFTFGSLSAEQSESVSSCGTAENIRVNIYDTKLRRYVLKNIPECRLYVSSFDGEGEVILAASELMDEYETLRLEGKGTIIAEKEGKVTLFDYYQNDR